MDEPRKSPLAETGPVGGPIEENEPTGGLWAYYGRRFYALVLHRQNRQTDHVHWFAELGLPDYGPEFDAVMRGRMTWDRHLHYFVLSVYGDERLPNHLYLKINRFFNRPGHRVVERPATEMWR